MVTQLKLGNLSVEVVQKDIKNLHLSVNPPTGRVRISAPLRTNLDTIRAFAVTKYGWIKQQQTKLLKQDRETPREYLERESHYVWGKRYLLTIVEDSKPAEIELKHNRMILRVRPGSDQKQRQKAVEQWYRWQLKTVIAALIAKWEPLMGVKVAAWGVKKMKTRWGTCNTPARRIWLNLELAKKPPACLEFVLVHELIHFQERHHNDRFKSLMDRYVPTWRILRDELNQAPLSHATWTY